MDYKLIADKTFEVFRECGIAKFPIDCFDILHHYGFKIYSYGELRSINQRLYEICRKYSNDAFSFQNMICYNECMIENRIRFSLMHELGHFVLGHKETSVENEDEADYFASCMLAPRIAVHRIRYKTADAIHDTFRISYAASNRVLSDYRKWRARKKYDSERQLFDYLYPNQTILHRVPSEKPPAHKGLWKEWRELEIRNRFIAENICDLEEYAFRERERQIYNGM